MTPFLVISSGESDLATGLADVLISNGNEVASRRGGFSTPADVRSACDSYIGFANVVYVCGDEQALVAAPIDATTFTHWDERGERLLRNALLTLQFAHGLLTSCGGGRIVIVTATTGISGAPAIVPYVTAVEGVRAMAKSAARQWGSLGITVNTVLVSLDLLVANGSAFTPFLAPPALGRLPDVADVAAAITSLVDQHVTGATVMVDGGSVLAP